MEDDILIDNYLKGQLSKSDEKSFLGRLKADNEFNEKFRLEEQLFHTLNENSWSFIEHNTTDVDNYIELLKDKDLQNLKKTLAQTNSEFNSSSSKPTRKLFYYLAAASIVVFLGLQFFSNSSGNLYEEYIELNDLPSFVSRSDKSDKLVKAQNLFENKLYNEALAVFKSVQAQTDDEGNLAIYKGITEMELALYNESEETFNSLINSNLLDAPKGYWYKALLYLKQDKLVESKAILNRIISDKLYNYKQAEDLLKDLE
ncbi:hypothetical protein [Winogradskyella sp. PE311]|uniref:hypothetical protein n=1 Tax=Winogradskyella sp. PE311 TaxID=3366943 RepID=UPI003980DE75